RVIAIVPASACVAAGRLQIAPRVGTDPDVGPGRRNRKTAAETRIIPSMRRLLTAVFTLVLGASGATQSPRYDVLIRNGRVIDGTGTPAQDVDIGIRGGRIVDLGSLAAATATRVIDAAGLTVTPGFIDVHSHASNGLSGELKEGRQLLAQGITTVAL